MRAPAAAAALCAVGSAGHYQAGRRLLLLLLVLLRLGPVAAGLLPTALTRGPLGGLVAQSLWLAAG